MPSSAHKLPDCFGCLDHVFPMGPDGLRCPPVTCRDCPHKTVCLRTAMTGKSGTKVRTEMVDRAYDAGHIGFFKRWYRRKNLATNTVPDSGLKTKRGLPSAFLPWKRS